MTTSASSQPKSDIKDSVRHQFGQVAANYRTSQVHAQGADLEKMVLTAQLTGDERVLDAGCGAGHTALAFAPHVREVIAVDFTEAMLEQGRGLAEARGLTNVEFRLGDVEQLPFEDASFDVVVSRYSAHHWPNPQNALREFKRVLRSGENIRGQLLLADIVSFDDFTLDTFFQTVELLRDPSHVRDHTATQWLNMFNIVGLQAEVAYRWDVWLDFASWVERMATPPLAVEMIQALFDGAPDSVRQVFRVEPDYSFTIPGALIRSAKQSG
ncbi:MAG: class I SAM-dependent methyltransferase [Caldilineaceae bacterium]|nr:class I SAM-dependent methyltransferase [Caldilineaceae bacterium]